MRRLTQNGKLLVRKCCGCRILRVMGCLCLSFRNKIKKRMKTRRRLQECDVSHARNSYVEATRDSETLVSHFRLQSYNSKRDKRNQTVRRWCSLWCKVRGTKVKGDWRHKITTDWHVRQGLNTMHWRKFRAAQVFVVWFSDNEFSLYESKRIACDY